MFMLHSLSNMPTSHISIRRSGWKFLDFNWVSCDPAASAPTPESSVLVEFEPAEHGVTAEGAGWLPLADDVLEDRR